MPELDEALCKKLMAAAEMPCHIIAHCEAVAEKAMELCAALESAGLSLDRKAIYHAALLHDIARLHPEHDKAGAEWLEDLGYGHIAGLIRQHHDPEGENIDEAAVLYMADKLVQEAEPVTLRERFEKSREKCHDAEAIAAHERRRAQATAMAAKINHLCNMEVIV